ncbi:MAG: class II aldolase/adducin family protein [Burkholderiales bacterium]|nr:class II aldolase/adducin family protein [Burkholderiales bacterium]
MNLLDQAEALCPADTSGPEWRLRVELAACYRVFHLLGWTELIFNHITLRIPGETPAYLINPFGLNYGEVTAVNLVKVGHDGVPLQTTPYHVNRAGFIIHSAIHGARADAHCVMHTHTTAGMAVACKTNGLGHDDFYGAELFGEVAYHAFEGITVRADEGPRLIASLADKRVLILRNHGLLVCGTSVFNAFRWMWTLQRACEVQLAADTLKGANVPLADAVRLACAADAKAFEPRESLEKMLFDSVLRRCGLGAATLTGRT